MDGNTVRRGDMIVFLKSCIIPKGRISALHVRTSGVRSVSTAVKWWTRANSV